MKSALELAPLPSVLDMVKLIIGPNILLYNATYIIKEAQAPSRVSCY